MYFNFEDLGRYKYIKKIWPLHQILSLAFFEIFEVVVICWEVSISLTIVIKHQLIIFGRLIIYWIASLDWTEILEWIKSINDDQFTWRNLFKRSNQIESCVLNLLNKENWIILKLERLVQVNVLIIETLICSSKEHNSWL